MAAWDPKNDPCRPICHAERPWQPGTPKNDPCRPICHVWFRLRAKTVKSLAYQSVTLGFQDTNNTSFGAYSI